MVVNKYKLYVAVLLLTFLLFYGSKVIHLFTYTHTIGRLDGFYEQEVKTRRVVYIKKFPVIAFTTDKYTVKIVAPSFAADQMREATTVPVIYDPDDPVNAYAFTVLAYWGPEAVWLLPFALIWSAIMLGAGFVPKKIKIPAFQGTLFLLLSCSIFLSCRLSKDLKFLPEKESPPLLNIQQKDSAGNVISGKDNHDDPVSMYRRGEQGYAGLTNKLPFSTRHITDNCGY